MYTLKQGQAEYTNQNNQQSLIDPAVIKAAGHIYYIHCEVHPEIAGQPSGVAIHRFNHRGKVIFTSYPILLPEECFVPLSQIESYMY